MVTSKKDTPVTTGQHSKLSDSDLAAHIDRVVKELEKFPLHGELRALCGHLVEGARGRIVTERCPYSLYKSQAKGYVMFEIEPWTRQKLTHLVVTQETAAKWDLLRFQCANISLDAGTVHVSSHESSREISVGRPLTMFSIEHMKLDTTIERVLAWVTPTIQPGNRAILEFVTKQNGETVDFEGLLWADMTFPY
jgi:hypothetical protein